MAQGSMPPDLYDPDEINLIDYWRVIWKWKWLIGGLFITSVVAALIFGLMSPKIYESRATVLSPKEGGGSGLLSALGATGVIQQLPGISVPSLAPNRDLFVSILKSRTVAEQLVDQFDLQKHYETEFKADAIQAVQSATNISVTKEGVIELKVEDTDPKLAADIANAYLDNLDRLVSQFGTGRAGRERQFIVEQLAKAEQGLREAEDGLKEFQQKHQAVSLQEQARGAIEAAAQLKGEIMASEVQLQVVRNFATESNPEVIKLKRKIAELKRQLAQAQYDTIELPGISANPGHSKREIYLPPAKVPEIGLELARLTRDLKVQETVYTLLTQQLEQAKIAEAQDLPIVQVLDGAVPAVRKSKPKIRLNMALAGAVSLFLGIFLAFFLEYIERQKQISSNVQSSTSNVSGS